MHTAYTDDGEGGQAYESMLYDHHHQLNQEKKEIQMERKGEKCKRIKDE